MRQRSLVALREEAEHGDLYTTLPIGFHRTWNPQGGRSGVSRRQGEAVAVEFLLSRSALFADKRRAGAEIRRPPPCWWSPRAVRREGCSSASR